MPRLYEMTWDEKQARWVKMYRGKRYTVRCSVLGTPSTKEASREAANRWWRETKLAIDAASKPVQRTQGPLDDVLAALTGGKPWTSQEAVAAGVVGYLESLPPSKEAEALADHIQEAAYLESEQGDRDAWEGVAAALGKLLLPRLLERIVIRGEPLPEPLREQLPPARTAQIESASKGLRGEQAVPTEQTVKSHVDTWLAVQERHVTIGEMTPARYRNVDIQMKHFLSFTGPDADISGIDAATIQGFYEHALSKIADETWSRAYSREMFATVRRFIRWVAEQGTIPLPPNIASRSFRFGATAKAIQVWAREEVRYVLGNASDRMRLYLLLMLNIGATQQDIADLQDSEVDWKAGRVTRKRSKTGDKADTPLVCYLLWPETFAQLQRFRSGKANVLLTETGKPLVRQELNGGKLKSADLIASNFLQLQRRLNFKKPLKLLRKTGASTLANHMVYGRFVQHYLGHAPSTMADRHYSQPPQQLFDEAIRWLGQQFNLCD